MGGNKVSVQSIINNPAVDPHDYEPTTKVGKSVASADLVVASGIGYDGWMDKVVKSADKSKNYLRVADDLMNKKEGDNEHIWYDPRTMPKLANTLADKFAKKDPADKATFKANAKKYIASLDDLNTLINKLKSKVNGQLVDVSNLSLATRSIIWATKSMTITSRSQPKTAQTTAQKISMVSKPILRKRKLPSLSITSKQAQRLSINSSN